MTEKEIEQKAQEIRDFHSERVKFCNDVGITLDDFFVKWNGDFEIEDMVRAYNKANEWHKVSEEGLPPNKPGGTLYLLWTIRGNAGSPVVADYFRKDKDEMHNIWTGATLTKEDVVSWKECKLPTE